MTDLPADVIDFTRARARRLQRTADPVGVEVRTARGSFALHGPDRGLYLYPQGHGPTPRWLSYDEAVEALERHIAAPSADI